MENRQPTPVLSLVAVNLVRGDVNATLMMSGGPSSGLWMLALEDEVMTNKKYLDALRRRLAGVADSSAADCPKSNSFRAVGVESVSSTMIREASTCLGVTAGLFKTVMSASLSAPVAVTVTQDDNAPPLTPLDTPHNQLPA
ncbi:hypothetical protein SNE40_010022 [Patella caerulea]|uniref:Uncharacterized protein n=1 Tax=Patella caerulea TaxID=87958 RepID=A0AAN8PTX3_PATCE